MTDRNDSIDCLHAVMLLFMIILHAGWDFHYWNQYLDCVYNVLYFYMPWFFYKSGMFFRIKESKEYAKRLLVPFFVFSFIGIIIKQVVLFSRGANPAIDLNALIHNFIHVGNFQDNGPLWFLFSLFLVQIIASFFYKRNNTSIVIVILIVSLALSIVIFHLGIECPLYLKNVCSGLFFFSAGMLLKDFQYNKLIALVFMLVFVCVAYFIPSHVDMAVNKLSCGYYELWMISSVCGCVTLNYIFKYITVVHSIKYIAYIGRNAIVLYAIHSPLLYLCKNYLLIIDNSKIVFFISISFIVMVSIPLNILFNKPNAKWIIGK